MKTKTRVLTLTSCAALFSLSVTTASAGDFLKCEKRSSPERSKISVEAGDLTPGALYTATVSSGGNVAMATVAADPGGDARYDFDSNANDVFAGATNIASNFINGSVTATVTNAVGAEIDSDTVGCRNK